MSLRMERYYGFTSNAGSGRGPEAAPAEGLFWKQPSSLTGSAMVMNLPGTQQGFQQFKSPATEQINTEACALSYNMKNDNNYNENKHKINNFGYSESQSPPFCGHRDKRLNMNTRQNSWFDQSPPGEPRSVTHGAETNSSLDSPSVTRQSTLVSNIRKMAELDLNDSIESIDCVHEISPFRPGYYSPRPQARVINVGSYHPNSNYINSEPPEEETFSIPVPPVPNTSNISHKAVQNNRTKNSSTLMHTLRTELEDDYPDDVFEPEMPRNQETPQGNNWYNLPEEGDAVTPRLRTNDGSGVDTLSGTADLFNQNLGRDYEKVKERSPKQQMNRPILQKNKGVDKLWEEPDFEKFDSTETVNSAEVNEMSDKEDDDTYRNTVQSGRRRDKLARRSKALKSRKVHPINQVAPFQSGIDKKKPEPLNLSRSNHTSAQKHKILSQRPTQVALLSQSGKGSLEELEPPRSPDSVSSTQNEPPSPKGSSGPQEWTEKRPILNTRNAISPSFMPSVPGESIDNQSPARQTDDTGLNHKERQLVLQAAERRAIQLARDTRMRAFRKSTLCSSDQHNKSKRERCERKAHQILSGYIQVEVVPFRLLVVVNLKTKIVLSLRTFKSQKPGIWQRLRKAISSRTHLETLEARHKIYGHCKCDIMSLPD